MSPKFGTSGLRGLVVDLTADLVTRYVHAFLAACPTNGTVHIGEDLRPSSAAIAQSVARAVCAAGQTAVLHGPVPTPALAFVAGAAGQGAIMVTGSHIPADRNGLKFYLPDGEIGKPDEAAIEARLGHVFRHDTTGHLIHEAGTLGRFEQRYVDAFGHDALKGLRLGVYQHSSVARDVMVNILTRLGAQVEPLARSDHFIPVDTEAVDVATRDMLAHWCCEHDLDAVVSTDGDGDRPMVTGPHGVLLPGDVLGPLTALFLSADVLVTPVSSNTLIDAMPEFVSCHRTRIGSPFVIEQMITLQSQDPAHRVIGYEANGGFLLGYTAQGPAGSLAPLMTRDSLLPMIAPLAWARAQGLSIDALAATLPPRFTATGRVQNIPTDKSAAFIASLSADAAARASFFECSGAPVDVDMTDGLRVRYDPHAVLHIRPSGNAPECRIYVEGTDPEEAKAYLDLHLAKLSAMLGGTT